jgi:hypothetical protein
MKRPAVKKCLWCRKPAERQVCPKCLDKFIKAAREIRR